MVRQQMAGFRYKIYEGSLHEGFYVCRRKIQIFGGGFANGKTTALIMKALKIAEDYPGAEILLVRATFPKIKDSIRKVFLKCCPPQWIAVDNKTEHYIKLTNGTTISFRSIRQQKSGENASSNLLSATYDFIGVDQMEDPEIVRKDFDDLLGRLRGDTRYIGNDLTMPKTGPRWLVLTCNPSRNWIYKDIVKPIHDLQAGIANDNLIVDENGECLIDLIEGSTYTNAENLPADYIKSLEATYKNQMNKRYLLGEWGAYEGLIYPQFDVNTHVIDHAVMVEYMYSLIRKGYSPVLVRGYDFGLVVPSCFLYGFADHKGNILVLDGFYEAELTINKQVTLMKSIQSEYALREDDDILADPSIFKRNPTGDREVVGKSVAEMFRDEDIDMTRGNNAIINGIVKVGSYLNVLEFHKHPINETNGAPYIYFSSKLSWLFDEFTNYFWKKNSQGEYIDEPTDRNDHGMDTLKYLLSNRPDMAKISTALLRKPLYLTWQETDIAKQQKRGMRYGSNRN